MHTVSVHPDDRFGQKASRQAHFGRYLTAYQLIELNLIGRRNHFCVAVIDLELRRSNLGVILLVLESHRALDISGTIDEVAQRIAGKRVIVAARVYVIKTRSLVE